MTSRRIERWLTAALVAAVSFCFVGSIGNGLVYDDRWLVTENPYVQSIAGLPKLFESDVWSASALGEAASIYRPLFMSSFLANRLVGGNSPSSYHVGNLLLHLVATLLLLRLLRSLLGRERSLSTWLVALAFGVAPLNSEPVAWISARCDLLGCIFGLAMLLANGRDGKRALALPLVAFAMLTKESFYFLPWMLPAHDWVLGRRLRDEWSKYAGALGIVAALFLLRGAVGVGSVRAFQGKTAWDLAQSYLFLLATFTRLAIAPGYLDVFRPYAPLPWLGSALTASAAVLVSIAAWRSSRDPNRRRARVAALGWIWFLASLGPVALTGPTLSVVGDRYAYVPMVGLGLAAAAATDALAEHLPSRSRRWRLAATCAALVLLVAAGRRTMLRVRDFHDEGTLFAGILRDNPLSPTGHYLLGVLYARQQDWGTAERFLQRSEALDPRQFRTHDALCFVFLNTDRLPDAEAECRESIAENGANPRAWVNLASTRLRAGAWTPCLDAATRAAEIKPRYAEAHYLAAVCLANLGRVSDAERENQVALELDPAHAGARSLEAQIKARSATP